MKVYLTGGTGFIGSYVAQRLSAAGHQVVILAKNPNKVPALKELPGITVVGADMRDPEALAREIQSPEALIHVALCWGDSGPEMLLQETLASVRLIELAVAKGAQRILYTSSTAATGYSHRVTDELSPLRPEDFYGATKGSVELFISAYAKKHPGIRFNILRPGYTFGNPVVEGASIESDSRFREICACARNHQPIELTRYDGTQFIWAGDLALLYQKIIEGDATGETFFGLSKKFVTWEQIAKWAIELTHSKSPIVLREGRHLEDPSLFSVGKIERFFGLSFDPTARLQDHLQALLAGLEQS